MSGSIWVGTMIKALLRSVLVTYPVRSAIGWVVGRPVTLFMLHRFADPDLGVPGHSAELLRDHLALLRREQRPLMGLTEVMAAVANGSPLPPGAVIFTVDDGYYDFFSVGAPVFREFDCPVTVFLGTGFLDRALWYWWDRVAYLLDHADLGQASLDVQVGPTTYHVAEGNRSTAGAAINEALTVIPEEDKLAAIDRLSQTVGVALPETAPAKYAPMTWEQVRACTVDGVTFGPHTVTHPALSRTSDDQCAQEITESWARVQAETQAAVPVFCYPHGDPETFGPREISVLTGAGLVGAVSASPGHLSYSNRAQNTQLRFAVPRFTYSGNDDFLQVIGGVERMKRLIRGG